MNINRNNYEEYFLLYADNELSESDKEFVEAFVQTNIDLKEEFLMIQRTVIFPDEEVQLIDKSFLLKKESSFITENNYEKIFVLYYDNELSIEQKKQTEIFAKQNIQLKTQFELIGKSKLNPDHSVIYPWKKELYKKENNVKIIFFRKVSFAAAVFIGFGLWISVFYFNKNDVQSPISITKTNDFSELVATSLKQEPGLNIKKSKNQKTDIAANNITIPSKNVNNKSEDKKVNLKKRKDKKELTAIKDSKIKNQIVRPSLIEAKPNHNLQLAGLDEQVTLHVAKREVKNPLKDEPVINQENKITSETSNTLSVQTISYDDSNHNYVFYDVPAEDFRKSKVGSFLKKVKRVVERNNPIARLIAGNEEQSF